MQLALLNIKAIDPGGVGWYGHARELETGPAAIRRAAAELRGSRVLVFSENLLDPLPRGGGFFI